MNSYMKLIFLGVAVMVSGCSLFSGSPKYANFADLDYTPENHQGMLHYYIDGAQEQLLAMNIRTQGRCVNGQMTVAQRLFDKAKAEYQHKLFKDAFITLASFDRQVRRTNCILHHLEGNFGCKLTNKTHVIKEWYEQGRFEQCQAQGAENNEMPSVVQRSNEILIEMLYEHDSSAIKPIYFDSLDKAALLLIQYPESIASIIGHTDSIGSNSYNKDLANKRANEVAGYLIDKGVSKKQISIASHGEEDIREVERNDVSRVFNRYSAILITLSVNAVFDHQGVNNG